VYGYTDSKINNKCSSSDQSMTKGTTRTKIRARVQFQVWLQGLPVNIKKVGSRIEIEKYFARAVLLTEIIGPISGESINWLKSVHCMDSYSYCNDRKQILTICS
jgi:hypothetical protein